MLDLEGAFFASRDAPSEEEAVFPTSTFLLARTRLLQDLNNHRGNIRLIIGPRGTGKSTCQEYLARQVALKSSPAQVTEFNAGLRIPKYLDLKPGEAVQEFFKDVTQELTAGKTSDLVDLKKKLKAYTKVHFLFVDNLDRLHQTKADLEFINNFFRIADPLFKSLESNIVTVITAAPEWDPIISQQDLSYLNYKNCIELKPLSYDELVSLLELRATSVNRSLRDYFNPEFLKALHTAARGNPRTAIQYLELFRNSPKEYALPLGISDFKEILSSELASGSLTVLKELATDNPQISWGANQLFRFFDEVEKGETEVHNGVQSILKALQGAFPPGLVPRKAWHRVSHFQEDDGRRVLNSQVRDLLNAWSKKAGLSKEVLLTIYAEQPFTATATDVQEFAEEYMGDFGSSDPACHNFLGTALNGYTNLKTRPISEWDRKALVLTAWTANQNLVLSVLAYTGRLDLRTKQLLARGAGSGFEEGSQRLLDMLSDIFRRLEKQNPHRGELVQLREMVLDVQDNPTVIPHWEDYQVENARQAGLKTFESLLRLLKPKNLRIAYSKDDEAVLKRLALSEGQKQEFKTSMSYDLARKTRNPVLEEDLMKAVAGMANAEGGTILVGIQDNGVIAGLAADFGLAGGSQDHFQRRFMDLFDQHIGRQHYGLVSISFALANMHEVCVLDVVRSEIPVVMKNHPSCLMVRAGSSTRRVTDAELAGLMERRFPGKQIHPPKVSG